MEHVADIKSFMESSLAVLKLGGKIIVSVPNNDCLMFEGEDTILNMPPHHMGMWNINSLLKLQDYFNMRLEAIYLEPLAEYHLGYTNKIAEKAIEDKLKQKLGPVKFIANGANFFFKKIARCLAFWGISSVSKYIIGHSILVVFRKNED